MIRARNMRSAAAAAAAAAALATLLLAAGDAGAIPAFARKYRMSCTTCHAPFPRLKPYGEEFAARGFRLEPGQEPARAVYDVGDPLLLLPRDLPLAARLDGYLSWKEDAQAETDFELPWVWKILSGGPLSRTASYYFYFLLERGEVVGVEDAYVQLNEPLGAPVALMVGQFQICDPLFKRELRLQRSDYEIYKTQVGLAPVDLTYDRGVMLAADLPGGLEAVVEIVNGNGIGPAAADERAAGVKRFDQDRFKNYALRLARSQGSLRLGVFGYAGRAEDAPPAAEDKSAAGAQNTTYYLGPDLVLDLGARWQLGAQLLYREDSDPFFTGQRQLHLTRGGFGELHFFPHGQDGRWALSGLYNRVESHDDAADRESAALTVNRLVARNLRLLLEGDRDLAAGRTRLTLGLVSAF